MSDCRPIKDLLSPFLDGELAPEKKAEVEEHIVGCEDCRTDLEIMRRAVQALHGLPELPAPREILRGVRRELAPRPLSSRLAAALRRPWTGVPVGAAATMLVAFGVYMLAERNPELARRPDLQPKPAALEAVLEKEELPDDEAGATAAGDITPPPRKTVREEAGPGVDDQDMPPAARPAPEAPRVERLAEERAAQPAPVEMELSETLSGQEAAPPQPVGSAGIDRKRKASSMRVLEKTTAPAAVRTAEDAAPPRPVGSEKMDFAEEAPSPRALADTPGPGPAAMPDKARAPRMIKRTPGAPASVGESTPSEGLPEDSYRKSLPPRELKKEPHLIRKPTETVTMEDRRQGEANRGLAEGTEVLTVVSFGEDEVSRLRQSLEDAGGRLLEMKTLDTPTSRQVIVPFQDRIPPSQVISRGWQIRAMVPISGVESFVSSLGEGSQLQLLHRTTVPAVWPAERGTQNIEINVVR